MKRTRRIEVIRYRRTVTATRDTSPAADPVAVEPEADLILEALAVIPQLPPAPLNCDAEVAGADRGRAPRQRLLSKLNDLLRRQR